MIINAHPGVTVPDISDADLNARLGRLTPLYQAEGDEAIHRIEMPDPRRHAFTWSPTVLEQVEFTPVVEVSTDHTCAYHGFFKPSLAEVLAQVPDDLPAECSGFYIKMETVAVASGGDLPTGHRVTTVFGIIK